jgi:acetyltransferase-like isoleucine patch superfamily enzyme
MLTGLRIGGGTVAAASEVGAADVPRNVLVAGASARVFHALDVTS